MLFFFIFLALLITGIYLWVEWSTHLDMVNTHAVNTGWGSYKDFKREFHKINWRYKHDFPTSVFCNTYFDAEHSQFHANIISFNSKGMKINNPISFILCKLYVKKYINKNFRQKVKW
jgi:hypothetical protein